MTSGTRARTPGQLLSVSEMPGSSTTCCSMPGAVGGAPMPRSGATYRLAGRMELPPAVRPPPAGERSPAVPPRPRIGSRRRIRRCPGSSEHRRSVREYGDSADRDRQLGEFLYRVARIRDEQEIVICRPRTAPCRWRWRHAPIRRAGPLRAGVLRRGRRLRGPRPRPVLLRAAGSRPHPHRGPFGRARRAAPRRRRVRGDPRRHGPGALDPLGAGPADLVEVRLDRLRPGPEARRRGLSSHVPGGDRDGPGPVCARVRRFRPFARAAGSGLLRRDLGGRIPAREPADPDDPASIGIASGDSPSEADRAASDRSSRRRRSRPRVFIRRPLIPLDRSSPSRFRISCILSSTQRTVRPSITRDLGVGVAIEFPERRSGGAPPGVACEEAIELLEHDEPLVGVDLRRGRRGRASRAGRGVGVVGTSPWSRSRRTSRRAAKCRLAVLTTLHSVIRTRSCQSSSRLAGDALPSRWPMQKLAYMLWRISCSSSRRRMRLSRCRRTRACSRAANRSQMTRAASSRARPSGERRFWMQRSANRSYSSRPPARLG